MSKLWVADTNVLLDEIESLEGYKIVLLSHTLRELEVIKATRNNEELKFQARRATRYIKENINNFHFDIKDYNGSELGKNFSNTYEDNNILSACKQNSYGIITKDILLQYKAKGLGIEVIDIDDNKDIDYKGYKFVDLSDTEMAYLYENMSKNVYGLLTNQYLIVRNNNKRTVDRLRWNGEKHVSLHLPPKKIIEPYNDLQACALDLLNNTSIPIKIIAGTYGSGKTLLNTKMATYHVLEKGNYGKIMMVRNPIGSGEEIGFLQGNKDKKTEGFFKPIIQHLEGGEQEAEYLEQRGQLLREIPFYMKGLSINDTFILVDEAEDLDTKLIKLIGTRLGCRSVVTFSGDYNQSEDKYKANNGLLAAINKLKGDPLVGIIVLDRDVRSEASRVFAKI